MGGINVWRKGAVVAVALVDDCDLPRLGKHKWQLSADGYAVRSGRKKSFKMHRVVAGDPDGFEVDHINVIRLDNRRLNLRLVANLEQAQNRSKNRNGSSRFRGVYWHTQSGKWRAKVTVGKKTVFEQGFADEATAAAAAAMARRIYMSHSEEMRHPTPAIDDIPYRRRWAHRAIQREKVSRIVARRKEKWNKSSKFLGVCWNRRRGLWLAQLKVGGRLLLHQFFDNELSAARAASSARKIFVADAVKSRHLALEAV